VPFTTSCRAKGLPHRFAGATALEFGRLEAANPGISAKTFAGGLPVSLQDGQIDNRRQLNGAPHGSGLRSSGRGLARGHRGAKELMSDGQPGGSAGCA